ncbi:MAG TPA: energy transducer TonB [Allosphingosinicella sp.]|jgi:hypothetical protein
MMKAIALPLLAAFVLPLLAAGPPPLQPTKGWVLDYADTDCTATRQYGSDAEPFELVLRPSPFGHVIQLIVLRNGLGTVARHVPATVTLPHGPLATTALRYWDKNGHEIMIISFESDALAQMRAAATVGIRTGDIDETFAVPSIGQVMQGLDTCNADLRRYWNVEGGATVAVPARPLVPLARYFSAGDYPSQAADENRGGTSEVTMMVDETGTMRDCLVEKASGIATLDAMTCGVLMQHAKFHPAVDAAGKPVRSILQQSVTWKLGQEFDRPAHGRGG